MTRARTLGERWIAPGVVVLLFALQFVLPAYGHASMTRILVLAVFATGYNLAFGYAGLLSLGHAMFFAAGLYGAGLTVVYLDVTAPTAFAVGGLAGLALSVAVGAIALRTTGVAFMIVTLMLAQAAFLTILTLNDVTHGDEGFVMPAASRLWHLAGFELDLSDGGTRYNAALGLFAAAYGLSLFVIRSPIGRVLAGVRENEERVSMLGYDTQRYKLLALALSGTLAGMAGALYALLFGYVGATFASIQYSILPLLWVLLGGAGTALGPLIGTGLMFVLIDRLSGVTSSYLIAVGVVLIVLVVAFPKGIAGTIRDRLERSP